ncbi:MAG: alanine racemase [Sulfurospirillaceae bacterium]|nr:alanine racemase [Sulfurospirillaceae bacterium]MDD2827519.1 alanine racemase [Sulfurospirillaceae bacterium]
MAYIILNKAHYFHNLDILCAKAGGKECVMAVLKDNAYGHGLEEMATLASAYGLRRAAVKNLVEAHSIVSYFDEVLILADHPPMIEVSPKISFAVHSYEALAQFSSSTGLHLGIDTGMHRNGVREDEIEKALTFIAQHGLNLKGIYTHFRSSDELSSEFYWQRSNFEHAREKIQLLLNSLGLPHVVFHAFNSAGLLRTSSLKGDDFARCGIAMYGYSTLDSHIAHPELKPVLSLWAEKLSSRILKKGERVGYGGLYEALQDECISTYDIGYGDGFFRFDGSKPLTMADGSKTKGRMSMDSFCLGGEANSVCVFEDAEPLADAFNTISYEIITKLSPFMKRIII